MPPDEYYKQQILKVMAFYSGPDNTISRADMLEHLNFRRPLNFPKISDRKMRDCIEELRMDCPEGARICASLDGGYYTARNAQELAEALWPDKKRIGKLSTRIKTQERLAFNHGLQPELL